MEWGRELEKSPSQVELEEWDKKWLTKTEKEKENNNSNDNNIEYSYKRSDAECNCSLLTNKCPASLQPAAARWLTSLFLKIFHLMLYGME